ncbi:MAG: hypothetical protein HYV63_24415 [Candidatus Schekmanbacteria bacterium]|nr:hypothetical protein [Candidatus Schekmanbacteria bacterium]
MKRAPEHSRAASFAGRPHEHPGAEQRILPVIGLMGSATRPCAPLAGPAGRLVAALGCHLLTGGGGGVMAEASRAYCLCRPRAGLCLGILKGTVRPAESGEPGALAYDPSPPNPWVELPIYTHLPHSGDDGRLPMSRNHINVLTSDVLVALPGDSGTLSEVTLRIDYGRSVILFTGDGEIGGHRAEYFRELARYPGQVTVARTPGELARELWEALKRLPPPSGGAEAVAAAVDRLLRRRFRPPDLSGKHVLVLPIGGTSAALAGRALGHRPAVFCGAEIALGQAERCRTAKAAAPAYGIALEIGGGGAKATAARPRVLAALRRLAVPWIHVVVGPGCDGNRSADELREALLDAEGEGRYRGCFDVFPLVGELQRQAAGRGGRRRPLRVIAQAARGGRTSLDHGAAELRTVPRRLWPVIPRIWLTKAVVVDSGGGEWQ